LAENPLTFLLDMEFNVSEAHVAIDDFYSSLNSEQLPTLIRACGDGNSILATNETLFSLGAYYFVSEVNLQTKWCYFL